MIFGRMMSLRAHTYVDFHTTDQDDVSQNSPPWAQKTKIVASKDEVSSVLLAWSGLREVWQDHQLGRDRDFLNDIVMLCDGTSIDVEAHDEHTLTLDDRYAVFIDNPEVARDQMVKAIAELISQQET